MPVQPTQHAGITAVLNPSADTLEDAYVWGMASTVPDLTDSGFAPTLNDALFHAFSSAVAKHPLEFLSVYCSEEVFANRLTEFNPYQHVRVNAWTENTPTGRLVMAGRKTARDRLLQEFGPAEPALTAITGGRPGTAPTLYGPDEDDANMPTLTIATDGSHGKSSSSWAWVTATGRHGSGAGAPTNPLSAEVRALGEALKHAPKRRPVLLVSDSKWAISHARRVQQDPNCSAMLDCQGLSGSILMITQGLIRKRENVTYKWVKGHAGNPLNEAADRLAVHTRRCHEARLPITEDVVAQIVQDMLAATAQPLPIAS